MKYISAVFIFLLITSTIQSQTPNQILATELDTYIENHMTVFNITGLSACIVKGDKVVWKAAYGMANIDLQIPVTLDTKFTLASISKLFTATACAKLWEDGLLDIDADINNYLPFDIVNPNFPTIPITTRQLLQHQSGLRDHETDLQIWEAIGDPTIPLADFCQHYFVPGGNYYDDANFGAAAPGQADYWYSNAGFTLLGFIVQEVSGMPFDEYCKVNIQDPLEMNTAAWFYSDVAANSVAMPYNNNLQPQGYYSVPEYPAAMLKSNINELANFLIAYTQGGKFKGFELLQPNTFATVVPQNMMNGFAWWGLNTWWGDTNGNFWSHGGFMDGIRTQLNYYPADSAGLIILTNGEGSYSQLENELENYIPLFDENEVISTIEELASSIEIYPNPIHEENLLTINLSGVGEHDLECILYNSLGMPIKTIVLNNTSTNINVSDLPKGIYLGSILQNKKTLKQFKCVKVF